MEIIVETPSRTLSIVSWREIRDETFQVNEELGMIIDAVSPDDSYKFVKGEYSYGDLVIKNGVVQFPDKQDNLVPLSSVESNRRVKKELNYGNMPLSVFLDKDYECFIDTGTRAVPLNLFHKGGFTGVYETMDFMTGMKSEPIWNFSAGSRSIIMLPKITDRYGLKRLRSEYNIPPTVQVKHLSEHWLLFKYIAQSKQFQQKWRSKMLFFGNKWLTNKNNSQEWQAFKNYLLRQVWHQAQFAIDKIKFGIGWEKFAEAISLRRLQPNPYLIDQVKHILAIALGNFPGFRPINESQEHGPVLGLQEAFLDTYGLKEYIPTMLNVCGLFDDVIKPSSVYYSLSLPTLLEGSPLKRTSSTIMLDMREIKLLIATLREYANRDTYSLLDSYIEKIKIDYFHVEQDQHLEIGSSVEMIEEDGSFTAGKRLFKDRKICTTGPFLKGCLRISRGVNNGAKIAMEQ